jgi:hypothetical protein
VRVIYRIGKPDELLSLLSQSQTWLRRLFVMMALGLCLEKYPSLSGRDCPSNSIVSMKLDVVLEYPQKPRR